MTTPRWVDQLREGLVYQALGGGPRRGFIQPNSKLWGVILAAELQYKSERHETGAGKPARKQFRAKGCS